MMSNRKYTLLCKYKVHVWVPVFLCATYQESGSWCVSSPQGLLGDGPSSLHCSTGSWFPVQSPCACCSDTSESNEQLAHANQGEKTILSTDTSLAWQLDSSIQWFSRYGLLFCTSCLVSCNFYDLKWTKSLTLPVWFAAPVKQEQGKE